MVRQRLPERALPPAGTRKGRIRWNAGMALKASSITFISLEFSDGPFVSTWRSCACEVDPEEQMPAARGGGTCIRLAPNVYAPKRTSVA